MTTFSANLGLLFTEYDLPDAIHAAHDAGFDAVECHWPYAYPADVIKTALNETGLAMLGINTARGDAEKEEFGLSALPHRISDARIAIDQAIDYARAINCASIHVMAGNCRHPKAQDVLIENLRYATEQASDLMFLIEPINHIDLPDYALSTINQAISIMDAVAADHLKLMFDCYHVGKMGGKTGDHVIDLLKTHIHRIGHIQFASVPDRGTPDHGDVDYQAIFKTLADLNYTRPLGAEYKPQTHTKDSLDWLKQTRL